MNKVLALSSKRVMLYRFETLVAPTKINEVIATFFGEMLFFEHLKTKLTELGSAICIVGSTCPYLLDVGGSSFVNDLDIRVDDQESFNQILELCDTVCRDEKVTLEKHSKPSTKRVTSFTLAFLNNEREHTFDVTLSEGLDPKKLCTHLGDSLLVKISDGSVYSSFPDLPSTINKSEDCFNSPFLPNNEVNAMDSFLRYFCFIIKYPDCTLNSDGFLEVFSADYIGLITSEAILKFCNNHFADDAGRALNYLDVMRTQIEQSAQHYRELDMDSMKARIRVIREPYAKIQELQGKSLQLANKCDEYRGQFKVLQNSYRKKIMELKFLSAFENRKVTQMSDECNRLNERYTNSQLGCERLNKFLVGLKREFSESQEKVTTLTDRISVLESELKICESKIDSVDYINKRDLVGNLSGQISGLEDQKRHLEKKLNVLEREVERKLTDLEYKNKTLIEQVGDLQGSNVVLEKELEEREITVSNFFTQPNKPLTFTLLFFVFMYMCLLIEKCEPKKDFSYWFTPMAFLVVMFGIQLNQYLNHKLKLD